MCPLCRSRCGYNQIERDEEIMDSDEEIMHRDKEIKHNKIHMCVEYDHQILGFGGNKQK
jgi:predicted nuclease of restriction endonuclease-like RecB superfamily